jgi:hypothetical protein
MELWPTVTAFASDVGVSWHTAAKWRQRNRIPADWWADVLHTRPARRSGVTAALLVELAARDRQPV